MIRPLDRASPLGQARHLVHKMQHCGPHEQDRHDAREWTNEHGDGQCICDNCVRDEAKYQARLAKYGATP